MFTTWLRTNRWAAGILTIIRIYIGWAFLTAGWGKIDRCEALYGRRLFG